MFNANTNTADTADFDLSALIGKPKTGDTAPTDHIDEYIREMVLHKHPEVIDQLMNEMDLHKFWKKINDDADKYCVVKPLAVDRILNFYEGAVRGGMSINDTRVGVVVGVIISTYFNINPRSYISGANQALVSLCPTNVDVVSEFEDELKVIGEERMAAIKESVKAFSRGTDNARKIFKSTSLGEYMTNAYRMWVLSDDKFIKAFMMTGGHRTDMLVDKAPWLAGFHYNHPSDLNTYKSVELTTFTTPWARAKAMRNNIPARIREIRGY